MHGAASATTAKLVAKGHVGANEAGSVFARRGEDGGGSCSPAPEVPRLVARAARRFVGDTYPPGSDWRAAAAQRDAWAPCAELLSAPCSTSAASRDRTTPAGEPPIPYAEVLVPRPARLKWANTRLTSANGVSGW